jgi:glycosyltransferase involved in cell wall biosynthesis
MKFCWMMKSLGHGVVLYGDGSDENDAPCDEYVGCAGNTGRTIQELRGRVKADDFICLFHGSEQQAIQNGFPNHIVVEPGVGYSGTCARYRVFPSYAWLHVIHGRQTGSNEDVDRWYDAVIPHQVYPWEHPFVAESGDYCVFLGRATPSKGLHIAEQACERAGVRLVVAGDARPASYGEHAGHVLPEERGQLLGGARALLAPTLYAEPFGLVVAEAQACGTPTITTDWGAFAETVDQGVSGYRCRMLSEFVDAIHQAPSLDRAAIRERALARWSVEVVRHDYERYFERLSTLWAAGWET